MTEEEHIFVQITKTSNRKLLVLQLLANFFNHKDLLGVVIRTKIIHNLFQKNRSLDVNKLELFHLQFTDSIIELFQKLKKAKEQQYLLVSDEIHINDEMIVKLKSEVEKSNFIEASKIHAQNMSLKIRELYEMLVTDKQQNFSWANVTSFSSSAQPKYYREISINQYQQLTQIDRKIYKNSNATFEQKLLGRLNILQFKIKFLCGFVCKQQVVEVFEFRDSNDKFIYIENDKSFYFLEPGNAKGLDLSKNTSNKKQVLLELKTKNQNLQNSLQTLKTNLPETVQQVLKDYLDKISSASFNDDLYNVDEQTNILKTMLNININ